MVRLKKKKLLNFFRLIYCSSAIDEKTQKSVAIKKNILPNDSLHLIRVLREIKLLKFFQNKHDNIMHVMNLIKPESYEDFLQRNEAYFVMELMDTPLSSKIYSRRFTDMQICVLMYQLLSSIRFLHSANIVHRDIVRIPRHCV